MANILVSATFLTLSENAVLTVQGAFWMYASVAVLGWVWLYNVMPETKGLALEEVAALFHRDGEDGGSDVWDRMGDEAQGRVWEEKKRREAGEIM